MKTDKRPRFILVLFLAILAMLLLRPAGAMVDPLGAVRVDALRSRDISLSMAWWPDAGGKEEIGGISERPDRFVPLTRGQMIQGHSRAVHWLRLTLANNTSEPSRHVLVTGHPRLQSVTLFRPTPYGWNSQESGASVPLTHKPLRTTDAAFPVELAPGEHITMYLRIHSVTVVDLQTWIWTPSEYLENREKHHLFLLLVTGFSFLVALGSWIAYSYQREQTFLFLAGLHISLAALDLAREGLIQRWAWPSDTPFLIQIIPICAALALVFTVALQRRFLPLASVLPATDKVIRWLATASLAVIPVSFIDYALAFQYLSLIIVVYTPLSLWALLRLWRNGQPLDFPLSLSFAAFCVVETVRQIVNANFIHLPGFGNLVVSWPVLLSAPLLVKALVERKQALRLQLAVEKEVSQAKSMLLAHVTHDLRAPVNIILGYVRLLQRNPESPPAAEIAGDIERNARRLMHLIDDLIDQSRIEFRTLKLSPSRIDFGRWLNELERFSRMLCSARSNRFVLRQAADLPAFIRADGARLHQVLDNLITNANHHTRSGEITLEVSVMTDAVGPRMRFEVADTGTGIAPEDLPHLFEAFRRSRSEDSPADSRPGLGLGLSIASNLVQIMGGKLDVRSQPGFGSRFSFSIACSDAAGAESDAGPDCSD